MNEELKVLYIVGTGKSGSTLMGKLLGQIEGFVDVGELVNIEVQSARNERCGCGAPVRQCEFWSEVLLQGVGGIDRLQRARWRRLRTRYMPLLAVPGAHPLLRRYFAQVGRIHRAIRDVARGRVVVDGSKSVFYGAVLALFPDINVYTLHLVRDVRASEGSMYRLKQEGAGKFASRSTWWNSVRWVVVNWLTEWVSRQTASRYLRVRYEDVVRDPKEALAEIVAFVSEGPEPLDFIDGSKVVLGKTHSVAGSGVRFKQGEIELRRDDRWMDQLPQRERAIVDIWTRRFRRRYGY